MKTAEQQDRRVRSTAFEWLTDQVRLHGDVLPRELLAVGFELDGGRVPLLGPQGIFKPRMIPEIPLSITTIPGGPYDDGFSGDERLEYRYRGTDPGHHDNVGLRRALRSRTPLVYFHRVVRGKYLAAWPVYIVGDNPQSLTFTVLLDDARYVSSGLDRPSEVAESEAAARRVYVTATFRRRVHQQSFRERVLRAYREQCAFCRLRHEKLLDAAHIIPDNEPGGEPLVSNGLALCKLHHAAYDGHFIGIRPDYVLEVRGDILEEEDGPMLLHGLKEMHDTRIHLPSARSLRPDPRLLAQRYERFRVA